MFSSNDIKKIFIDFFKKNKHNYIESSSLIPKNDNSLLFTNSGMNQFKNIFLGLEKYKYSKVVTIQRCLRAGGKRNDINQVGYTPLHHTFFEMLGNFSFNDYFKEEAIKYAWKLLTDKKLFNIPEHKLYVSVYFKDKESINIWKKIGLSNNKIFIIGNKNNKDYCSDNFWNMNELGPCGPSSEIFYQINNTNNSINIDKKNFIEIWNLVFIQYNKINSNKLVELSYFSVDTGMGLERITSILQNVDSNYKIDIFVDLINKIINYFNINYNNYLVQIKIIADHIRSCIFMISDGITPSNYSHGYVLRKIIRRSIYSGKEIGLKSPFLYKIFYLIKNHINFYNYKIDYDFNLMKDIVYNEEIKFENSLKNGLSILNKKIKFIKNKNFNFLESDFIFLLYDTYGLPIYIIKKECYKNNIIFNENEFNILLNNQKIKSKLIKK